MRKANFSTRWFMVVADHSGITTPCQIAVLMSMKTFMNNDTGECYPTIKQLAKRARCTSRSVSSAIKKAVELGLLIVDKRYPKSGVGYTNNYYYPQIPGESIRPKLQKKAKPQEMKTKPQEMKTNTIGNDFSLTIPYNYTNNSYLNNRQSKASRIDGFQKPCLAEVVKNFSKKNSELNDLLSKD